MKLTILLIMIITLSSCSSKQEPDTFKSIDCSFYDGFFKSIKVLEDGKTLIWYNFNFQNRTEYYSFKMNMVDLDNLNKMANILKTTKLDSIYMPGSCDNCKPFSLIINFRDTTVLTTYRGDFIEKKLYPLFRLAIYLDSLSSNSRNNVDSIFSFKSKSRLILPPPPQEKPN